MRTNRRQPSRLPVCIFFVISAKLCAFTCVLSNDDQFGLRLAFNSWTSGVYVQTEHLVRHFCFLFDCSSETASMRTFSVSICVLFHENEEKFHLLRLACRLGRVLQWVRLHYTLLVLALFVVKRSAVLSFRILA